MLLLYHIKQQPCNWNVGHERVILTPMSPICRTHLLKKAALLNVCLRFKFRANCQNCNKNRTIMWRLKTCTLITYDVSFSEKCAAYREMLPPPPPTVQVRFKRLPISTLIYNCNMSIKSKIFSQSTSKNFSNTCTTWMRVWVPKTNGHHFCSIIYQGYRSQKRQNVQWLRNCRAKT